MTLINKKIKVLIVDDSAVVRKILTEELSKDPMIEIVGSAPDPFIAREKIMSLEPDVITLDIEMPKMDGLTFLKKIMKYRPTPVVIVSSITQRGSEIAMECLKNGAVDVIAKPGGPFSVVDVRLTLLEKIKAAGMSILKKISKQDSYEPPKNIEIKNTTRKIIAIGASTGGTEAIKEVLKRLPPNIVGIVVTQHMPPHFTKAFAERLNRETKLNVKEAENNDRIEKGSVLIAQGGYHLLVKKDNRGFYVIVKDGPMVCYQKPSVDVMFKSVANTCGSSAIGVILTGMGKDGADGLLEMKNAGSYNIAQNEESCVVFGMPKEAIQNNAIDKVLPIEKISSEIISIFK